MRRSKVALASGYRLIFGYLGLFIALIGIICLLPLILLIAYPHESNVLFSFLIPGLSALIGGIALWALLLLGKEKAQLGKFQDSVLLVLIWLSAIFIGSVPFMLRGIGTGEIGTYSMGFSNSIFESTSGYSASGLTLFNFSESAPGYHIYTFYRSILLLFGGVGLVLVVTSAISDRYGLKLYTAEGHNDKLMPNLAKSARMILLIYLGYITLGSLSYWLIGGMTYFDALNHAIAAVATGGFSTREGGVMEIIAKGGSNGIGIAINSTAINVTSIILMILGSTNFVLHLFLFQGKWKKILFDCEIRFLGILCVIFIPLSFVAVLTQNQAGLTPFQSFKEGTFMFFSSLSTTGFSLTDPIKLGRAMQFIAFIMMVIGGGMGSTAGGIKQYRVVLTFKWLYWSVRDRMAPKNKMFPHQIVRFNEHREVTTEESFEAFSYMLLYLAVVFAGAIAIASIGHGEIEIFDALFEFTSALSGTGLTVGVTAMRNFAVNWVLVVGMFLGRLEITAVQFALFRVARDILRKETV